MRGTTICARDLAAREIATLQYLVIEAVLDTMFRTQRQNGMTARTDICAASDVATTTTNQTREKASLQSVMTERTMRGRQIFDQ